MFSWTSSFLANPDGLWAAVALIPLLLVYLIRPKPVKQTIPSLMFLMRDRDKKRFNALFQSLVREFLLLLQLLILVGLIVALAQPYMSVPGMQTATDTVIVLDDSAALYATEDGRERWREAQEQAINNVGRTNTIVLAGAVPRVALEDASADRAREYLREWRPTHQPLRLTSAVLASQEFISSGGRVVVISTFQDTDQDSDYRVALATLRSAGADVSAVQIGTPGSAAQNVGIVDAQVRESSTRVEVQNYFDEARAVQACVGNSCTTLDIGARDVADWSFATPPGVTRVRIDSQDSFSLDNEITIVADDRTVVRTLVVTNSDFYSSYLYFALRSIEQSTPLSFEYTINTPPQLVEVNHDITIFYDVDPELLVGRTVRETADAVSAGSAAIILTQDGLFGLGYDALLPLRYVGQGGASAIINTDASPAFTDINFGNTPSYHRTEATSTLQELAVATDDAPVITLSPLGQGRVLYYGLPESASFSLDPLYPVFWRSALNALLDRRTPEQLNFVTGTMVSAGQTTTPSGRVVSGTVLLAEQGAYATSSGAIAANLLNPFASDTSIPVLDENFVSGYVREMSLTEQDITSWFIIFAIILLLCEVLYLKWRGDA